MKKLFFMAFAATAALFVTSCGSNTPKANLKTDVDSLSYALGMSQTQGLKEYLVGRLGIDTAYIGEFVRGLNDGVNADESKKKSAYYAGIQIGQQIGQMKNGINRDLFGEDSTKTISMQNYMAAFVAATTGKHGLMTMDQAVSLGDSLMHVVKARELEKTYGENKAAGEKFLAENAKKEGVMTLEGGVQYRVIKEGTGKIPADTSRVTVNYEGRTLDGNVFDSSYEHNRPLDIRANQVIKGWTTALTHMPAGSTWEVYIPQELAYGEREQRSIKPFSMLIFKMELLEVK